VNNLTIIGRLTEDPPEPRTTKSGHRVLDLRVAINRPKRHTVFVDVTCWDRTADNAARYLAKGSQVGITGELDQDEWTDAESGQVRRRLYVRAERVEFPDHRLAPAAQAVPAVGESVAAGP
jgi:single-strand DNA-binding protein